MGDEEKINQEIDNIVRSSRESGPHVVHDIFDGFMALSRVVQEVAAKKAESRRQRRNKRARERYALNKKLGITKHKPKTELAEDSYIPPTSCYCSTTPRPPCGWCEDGGWREEDE